MEIPVQITLIPILSLFSGFRLRFYQIHFLRLVSLLYIRTIGLGATDYVRLVTRKNTNATQITPKSMVLYTRKSVNSQNKLRKAQDQAMKYTQRSWL